MKVYQDITLLPADDIGLYFLWEKVYQQVHLALVEQQVEKNLTDIGIALPKYCEKPKSLGNKIRVFAPSAERLEQLNITQWLSRLDDYVHVTSIKSVPESISGYERFVRKQAKATPERAARRTAKKRGISYEEALKEKLKSVPELPDLPYLKLRSLSKNEIFSLFIRYEAIDEPTSGMFSCYGLSKGGCLPKF